MISGSGSAPRNPAPIPVPVPVPVSVPAAEAPGPVAQPQLAAAQSSAIRPYADGDAVNENEVIFLCPNGHQLCGPTTLGGNAGECPLCGIQFLVPSDDDQPEHGPAASAPRGNGSPFDFGDSQPHDQPVAPATVAQGTVAQGTSEMTESSDGANGLADLFDSFWAYKAHGATIELHLENGQVIAPGGYAPHLSRGSHAVFMMREANGLHTLAAVRWASISHIAVRGLRQLPEGVFDDS